MKQYLTKDYLLKVIFPKVFLWIFIIIFLYLNYYRTQIFTYCNKRYLVKQTQKDILNISLTNIWFTCTVTYSDWKKYIYTREKLENLKKHPKY